MMGAFIRRAKDSAFFCASLVIANAVTDAEQCCDLGEEVNLSGIIAALKEVIKASEQAG